MLTEIGPSRSTSPRDRDSSFDPRTVRKGQRRLGGVDSMVISLTAKGLTTGEVEAHLAEVYPTTSPGRRSRRSPTGARSARRVADPAVRPGLPGRVRRRDVVKIRDGQVANRPVYTAIGVASTANATSWVCGSARRRRRQVLAAGPHRDQEPWRRGRLHRRLRRPQGSARVDRSDVAAERHADLCAAPDPQHFPPRLPPRLGPASPATSDPSTPPSTEATPPAASMSSTPSGEPLPGDPHAVDQRLVRVRPVPGLRPRDQPGHLQHQRDRVAQHPVPSAARARGHFPNEQAALKCIYLVVRSLDPKGTGQERWINRWKPALNAFAITFEGRLF